jgi:hypothetical protein
VPAKTPTEKTTTNAAGEQIRTMSNGDQYLIPAHSAKAKVLTNAAAKKVEHAALVEVKLRRVATKKARQARKGWPPEKSPI